MLATTEKKMSRNIAAYLTRRFCRRKMNVVWGQRRGIVTPVLLPIAFGDGRQIIGLRPIMLRKSWYIIAIDSTMEVGGNADDFRDLLDERIYPELEDRFSLASRPDDEDEDYDFFAEWPAVQHECGHEWWVEKSLIRY